MGERSQAGVSALVTRRSTAEPFPLISISGPVEVPTRDLDNTGGPPAFR